MFSHTHSVSIEFLTSAELDRPASRDGIITKDICRVAVLHRAQVLLRVYVTYVRETTVLLLVVIDATTARVF